MFFFHDVSLILGIFMAAILENLSMFMYYEICINLLLLKKTLSLSLKKPALQNDIQLNRL